MFLGNKDVIGLDIGSRFIKAIQLRETKKGYMLERFGIVPIPPELIVDGSILDAPRVVEAIRQLIEESRIKAKDTVLSVSGHSSVIVKRISVAEMTDEELEESIKFEAEQYVPFDIEDVNLDFQILGPGEQEDQMEVIIVAVKKEKIYEYVSTVQEAGLKPIIVDVDVFTLENVYEINYPVEPGKNIALVNIGASSINMNIIQGGISIFTRDSAVGTNLQTEALQREFALSFEDAERLKSGQPLEAGISVPEEQVTSVISLASEDIIAEMTRSFDYCRNTTSYEEIHDIYISGGAAMGKDFPVFLFEKLGVEPKMLQPFKNIQVPKYIDKDYLHQVESMLVVATGLDIRRQGDR